jgi:transposase-like protein
MEKQSSELLLGEGMSVERIAMRFGTDPSTVSYWMRKYGLVSPHRERHVAKGGIERERLERLVERGMTIAEIAEEVGLSKGTVRHWLREYGLSTRNSRGSRRAHIAGPAKEAGLLTVTMTCPRHGETDFILEGRGYYRCKRCRADRVAERRHEVKAIVVEEAGGRCQLCGYDRCVGALRFHHVDPSKKQFHVSLRGAARSLARVREEAKKRVLLCANCHAEVEAGMATVALE